MQDDVERLANAHVYGASYSREKQAWAIYEMPPLNSAEPYRVIAETLNSHQADVDLILNALRGAKAQADTIATLQAKLDRAVKGLERQARGWKNVLELDIISERHRTSVNVLADEAQSLIKELRP